MEFLINKLEIKKRFDNREIKEPRKIKIEEIGNETYKITSNKFNNEFITKRNNKFHLSIKNEPLENALLYLKNQPFIYKTFSNKIRDFYEGEILETYGNLFLEYNKYKRSSNDKIERINFYDNKIYIKDIEKIGYDDILEYL